MGTFIFILSVVLDTMWLAHRYLHTLYCLCVYLFIYQCVAGKNYNSQYGGKTGGLISKKCLFVSPVFKALKVQPDVWRRVNEWLGNLTH